AYTLAQKWIQGGADGKGHAPSISEIAHRHTKKRVHGPATHAVVEHRPDDGILQGFRAAGLRVWWINIVADRAADGVKEHVDAHAGREEHCCLDEKIVFRSGVVWSHANLALGVELHPNNKSDDNGNSDDINPLDVHANPTHHGLHRAGSVVRGKNCP